MSDDDSPEPDVDRDEIINHAFERLVHDDLEGFLLLTSIDDDFEGVSFSSRYENPEEFDGGALCQLPLMELLGGCIAEVALEYGYHRKTSPMLESTSPSITSVWTRRRSTSLRQEPSK